MVKKLNKSFLIGKDHELNDTVFELEEAAILLYHFCLNFKLYFTLLQCFGLVQSNNVVDFVEVGFFFVNQRK